MSDRIKDKMSLDQAKQRAAEIIADLSPYCERIEPAGSIRRKKAEISDIEIVVIPKTETHEEPIDMFYSKTVTTDLLDKYIKSNPNYTKRLNIDGHEAYGDLNKLLCYKDTPLDVFSAKPKNWVMVMFIRTGSWKNNIRVAVEARKNGVKIEQFEGGFKSLHDETIYPMENEEQIYKFVGLPFLKPEERL